MKNGDLNVGEFVEKRLDRIIKAGEWVGSKLGGAGRGVKNVIVAVGVLVVFGIAAFLWAVGKGMIKKEK